MEPPGRQSWKPRDSQDVSWSQEWKVEKSWSGEARVAVGFAGGRGRETQGRVEASQAGPGEDGATPSCEMLFQQRRPRQRPQVTADEDHHPGVQAPLPHVEPKPLAACTLSTSTGGEAGCVAKRGTRALTDAGIAGGFTARLPRLIPALAPPGCVAL